MPSTKIVNASWGPNLVFFPVEDGWFRGVFGRRENTRDNVKPM